MIINEDIFRGVGIEVVLPVHEGEGQVPDRSRAAFLKVAETLTRMGKREGDSTLRQVCYILHKKGRYVIAHLSEMLWLDGHGPGPTEEDVAVRNRVATLLENWGLVDILVDSEDDLEPLAPINELKILAYRDKPSWNLVSEYSIGRQRREPTHV